MGWIRLPVIEGILKLKLKVKYLIRGYIFEVRPRVFIGTVV